jgi:hypothetical protein
MLTPPALAVSKAERGRTRGALLNGDISRSATSTLLPWQRNVVVSHGPLYLFLMEGTLYTSPTNTTYISANLAVCIVGKYTTNGMHFCLKATTR